MGRRTLKSSADLKATPRLFKIRDFARLARQLEDVHAGIGTIDNVDITAIVDFGVIGLDRDLAAVHAIDLDTALGGVLADCGNIVGGLARRERIADIHDSQAGIEPGNEYQALVINRP